MRNASNAALGFGAAAVAILIAIVAGVFGIAPRLSAASDADAERQQQLDTNETLQATLDKRIKDDAEVPTLKAKTAEIAKEFPSSNDVAPFRQALLEAAANSGVTIVKEEWATPSLVDNTLEFQPAADVYGLTSPVDGLTVDTLYENPITISIAGKTEQVFDFLDYLQGDEHQYFLVSALTAQAVTSENTVLGRVLRAGDVNVSISGYTFTLDYAPPPPPLLVSRESAEPKNPNYRNLFLPIPTD